MSLGPPSGPPAGPPPGPPPSGPRVNQRALLLGGVAVVVVIVIIAVAASGGGGNKQAGAGEIFLERTASDGADPFTQSVAARVPTSTIPPDVPVSIRPGGAQGPPQTAPAFPRGGGAAPGGGSQAITTVSGGTPGLYGGTRDQSSCDPQRMIDFLTANPAKGKAWADAEGIPQSDIASYVRSLTPVILRSDTRVTNHGLSNGRATPHQSVLQAGTAVLVDNRGVPRARCACGNPLLPPQAVQTTPKYTGPAWPGFNPGNVTVINQSTTVINIITVVDITNGGVFGLPPGPGGRPVPLPAPNPPAPPPVPPTPAPPTATQCAGFTGRTLLETLTIVV